MDQIAEITEMNPVEDFLYTDISWFSNNKDTSSKSILLKDALEEIKNGTFQDTIALLRNMSEDDYKKNKGRLKGYTFGGMFSQRKGTCVTNYSRVCILDFDHIPQEELDDVKKNIFENQHILAAWVSPSGKGIKALTAFNFLKEPENAEEVVAYHKAAYELFKNQCVFCFPLDESGKDVGRLCFTSWDPDLLLKSSFVPFEIPADYILECDKRTNRRGQKPNSGSNQSPGLPLNEDSVKYIQRPCSPQNRAYLNSIYRYLSKRSLSITGSYYEWYMIGQALANTFSYEVGKKYFLKLCCLDGDKHDDRASRKKIIECYAQSLKTITKRTTIGSIIFAAQQKGWNLRRGPNKQS